MPYERGASGKMNFTVRPMNEKDKPELMEIMRDFYSSPAVYTNGSDEIFSSDIDACIGENPFLEGFIAEVGGEISGYTMVAKSFSTEFGKTCIWIEDLYIKEEFRTQGLGKALIDFVLERYHDCIFRLEVEEENERAIALYKKCGFSVLPYMEMKKDRE